MRQAPPPPPALEAHRLTFDRIIWRISNFAEPFAHYKSKTGECSIPGLNLPLIHGSAEGMHICVLQQSVVGSACGSGVALGEACTIVLRGASSHILEEAERSLHDALCVLQATVRVSGS